MKVYNNIPTDISFDLAFVVEKAKARTVQSARAMIETAIGTIASYESLKSVLIMIMEIIIGIMKEEDQSIFKVETESFYLNINLEKKIEKLKDESKDLKFVPLYGSERKDRLLITPD